MKRLFFLSLLLGLLSGCDLSIPGTSRKSENEGQAKKTMTYSFACLDSAVAGNRTNRTIGKAGDLLRKLAISDESVTDAMQNEYGAAFHKDAIESKTFVLMKDEAINAQLTQIMNELLEVREQPSAIRYAIYGLEDTTINAFTFGGRIYVTRAMYNRCKGSPALLYAIIGHEIGHSECGHIKRTIQELELATDIFGQQSGTTVFQIKRLLTGSFNQKNELEADYYGTDLAYRLNQDICAAVGFWKDMARQENRYNKVEDFFRTHPFSSLRAQCLQDHIRNNFSQQCGR
jgi:predicted Zn-dependent protease